MSWKTDLKLADLDPHTKIECTCRRCGHVHYADSSDLASTGFDRRLYLDEVEAQLRCMKRHCRSPVRIALVHDDMEGFVAGMA
jgi:ribosomal protein L37E